MTTPADQDASGPRDARSRDDDRLRQNGRRVYRSDGRGTKPRSPVLALLVLVAVAVVIAVTGVAANSSALDGSQSTPSTFKLLPVTTTPTS